MAPVPSCCIGANVGPAPVEVLLEVAEGEAEAPDATVEVGVEPAAAEEVVVETSVKLSGLSVPQLAVSSALHLAWEAESPTWAALQSSKVFSQRKVGIV
jgi:hypothetical protein